MTKMIKLRNEKKLYAFINPLPRHVASGQQMGVPGGGAPWHDTCVGNRFF